MIDSTDNMVERPTRRGPWYVLADPFSWFGWQPEGAVRVLPPKGPLNAWRWRSLLRRPPVEQAEFLLVESAWEGFPNKGDQYTLPLDLVRAFRKAGIPTVYWNKEDPISFEKFIGIARECDVVLTTDTECIERYRAAGCRGPVELMTFAAQPALHRQYLPKQPGKNIFFAGTLRSRYAERMIGYDNVLKPALEMGLHIFSRKGTWPEECRGHVVGSYPYRKLLRKYSAYLIGLNMSSVKHSATMFPRRVVEMPLANVFVISDECRAIRELLPEIPCSNSPAQTRDLLQHFLEDEADRTRVLDALRSRILREFTYEVRLRFIRELLAKVGYAGVEVSA